jgi:hypothetical protein
MKSGNLNFLEPPGHSRPVTGLLYLYLYIENDYSLFVPTNAYIILICISPYVTDFPAGGDGLKLLEPDKVKYISICALVVTNRL